MSEGKVIIYYHDTCPTSIKLIDTLEKEGLLDLVRLINVRNHPFLAINRGVLSVPAIEIDGEIIDFGPIDFDYVISKIKGLNADLEFNDKLKGFKITILDNLFLALSLYIHEDVNVLLDYYLIRKRLGLLGRDISDVKKELGLDNIDFYRSIEEKLLKVIAINLLREVKWLNNIDLTKDEFLRKYSIDVLSHWLAARGSIARVGLIIPNDKSRIRCKAIKLHDFIRENWDYLMSKI